MSCWQCIHATKPSLPSAQGSQGAPSLSRASDGARFQYLWRYRAATDKWDVVHQVKSTVVAQSNPQGDDFWTQTMASISASRGSALYASWSGEEGVAACTDASLSIGTEGGGVEARTVVMAACVAAATHAMVVQWTRRKLGQLPQRYMPVQLHGRACDLCSAALLLIIVRCPNPGCLLARHETLHTLLLAAAHRPFGQWGLGRRPHHFLQRNGVVQLPGGH